MDTPYNKKADLEKSKKPSKRRTGCEQCKRRKVRCDEAQPECSRCVARGETCTGNFPCDRWQVERPWLSSDGGLAAASVLENDTLRHWYDKACLTMAIFHPPVNPLSHGISAWLRRSKALRHTLESVAAAHHEHFIPASLAQPIRIRGLAISSLKGEVAKMQSPSSKDQTLQRTIILSSLILCISASWVDPSCQDFGMEFLSGARSIICALADSEPTDPFAFYVLGLSLYCDAFWSYLFPSDRQPQTSPSVLRSILRPPFSSCVHPVTGIATTLCPLIAEVGHHYRRVLDTRRSCSETHQDLESRLQDWQAPEQSPRQPQLVELAEGYRAIGIIMLYQSKAVVMEPSDAETSIVRGHVFEVMKTIKHLPDEDPLLNWVGPLLVIAGSELPSSCLEERSIVERAGCRLATWTRVPSYQRALELVREVWSWRDMGLGITWLELMVTQGLSLAIG